MDMKVTMLNYSTKWVEQAEFFASNLIVYIDCLKIIFIIPAEEAYLPPPQEFDFVNSVVCDGISNHKDKEIGITTLTFDLHEDLLWAGTKSGHVS